MAGVSPKEAIHVHREVWALVARSPAGKRDENIEHGETGGISPILLKQAEWRHGPLHLSDTVI